MDITRAERVDGDWREISRVYAALGDEYRQKVLLLFDKDEELSISEIAACFSLSKTAISHHLRTLREAGVLKERRSGKETLLSVDREFLTRVLEQTLEHVKNPKGETA